MGQPPSDRAADFHQALVKVIDHWQPITAMLVLHQPITAMSVFHQRSGRSGGLSALLKSPEINISCTIIITTNT